MNDSNAMTNAAISNAFIRFIRKKMSAASLVSDRRRSNLTLSALGASLLPGMSFLGL